MIISHLKNVHSDTEGSIMPGKQTELKIILSADSTCDLDEDLKERYNVHYFPLHINLNGKDYLDNIDITPEEIYQEYYDHKTLPKTAAVNVQEYIDHFRPWVEAGYEVIHVNLGHALSSSYQNCCLAARELGHVHVVDSCNLSTGTGLTVVAAGKLLREAFRSRVPADRTPDRSPQPLQKSSVKEPADATAVLSSIRSPF